MVSESEFVLEIVISHPLNKEIKILILLVDTILRHWSYSDFFLIIIPRSSVGLIHRCRASCSYRQTDPKELYLIFIFFKNSVGVVSSHLVLSFIINMEYSDFSGGKDS